MGLSEHPTSASLLLWQSGELDLEAMAAIKAHLAGCPACQAKIAALESLYEGIAAIDDKAAEQRMQAALQSRRQTPRFRLTHTPRWVAATAALIIISLMATSITEIMPSARAETLLTKAAQEQAAEAPHAHFLRVRTATLECNVEVDAGATSARLVLASESDFCGALSADLNSAGWKWNDLLSARSFLHWRNALNQKKDSIQKFSDAAEVTTTSATGPLHRATLRLRSSDHRPVSGRFVFADSDGHEQPEVDVTESSEPPASLADNSPAPSPVRPTAALSPAGSAIDPFDVKEVEVRLALHQIHADGNILLSVSRESNSIRVSGVVPSQEAKAEVYGALRNLPQVETAVAAEGEPRLAENTVSWQPFRGDTAPLGYERINALYPDDPEGRQKFVNGLDAMTRRLVGEAKTHDALLALASRIRGSDFSARAANAAAEIQVDIATDATALAVQFRPLIGSTPVDANRLTYPRAMELYTLVHEVVLLNRSGNPLTLEDSVGWIHGLLSGGSVSVSTLQKKSF
jgi:hypothetical protein